MNVQKHDRQSGFTLVELMVVVVILGLLGGIGAVAFRQFGKDAKLDLAAVKCADLEKAVSMFVLRNGSFDADDVWDEMLDNKKIKKRKDIKDPWGEEFIVTVDEDDNYIVTSKGPDKQQDTEDDLGRNGKLSEQDDDS